jgi:hypothetical protein
MMRGAAVCAKAVPPSAAVAPSIANTSRRELPWRKIALREVFSRDASSRGVPNRDSP